MHDRVTELYPLCRSITGAGLRETLAQVRSRLPALEISEVSSGSAALDWEVPDEWNIRAGRIESLDGQVLVDFAVCNLHVVSYSVPVDCIVSREELAAHVHTLPAQPSLIPYRTAYYAKTWGFCLAHEVWEGMRDARYRVFIDSTLAPGALSYGELVLAGRERAEVLISVHCCHPSLANDNLSGIALAMAAAQRLYERDTRLTYRFLFIPATIGSLTWLARNESLIPDIAHGVVLSCVGDPGKFHYKRSRRGAAAIDRAMAHVLRHRDVPHALLDFSPFGYDERQFCSPGYDMPVGCFMRSPNGTFPEYHTSADNPGFVTPAALAESLSVLLEVFAVLEADLTFSRVDGRGEPQLGRRGLYRAISGQSDHASAQMALLWVLNLADGRSSLLDMAERSGLRFAQLAAAAKLACDADLIRRAD